jgi:hypothetical protein
MHISEFAEATGHIITGGSEYQWQCYGDHARWLDAGWSREGDQWQASAVFDSRTQRVYECQIADFGTNQSWVWRDPEFSEAHDREAQSRGVDPGEAWDHVRHQLVPTTTEILNRIRVTVDRRETVALELENEEMLNICMRAHELDMTLNAYIEMILRDFIERNHPEVLKPEATMGDVKPKKSGKKKKQ